MTVSMDLNASPLPDDEEETYERHIEEYTVQEEHVESAVEISRRERKERKRRMRERPDERSMRVSHPPVYDGFNQVKRPRSSRIPPGWLDCPSFGQEICGIVPSKVPLGEAYNDEVPPGKRYSFKQVLHQQRVLGRKIGLVIDLTNTSRYYQTTDLKKEGIKYVKTRGNPQFPGSHPVSLNRENLQLLRQRYYFATWKADGTRYMMLITVDGCFLIDRSFNFRRVQMRFPCRTAEGLGERVHHYTLLDGEMIIDTLPDSQKQERRYLIYDMMALNQVSVVEVGDIHLILSCLGDK